jgi:hypothetical protein
MHITSATTEAELKSFIPQMFSLCQYPTGLNNSFTIIDYANANILSYDNYDNGYVNLYNAVKLEKESKYETFNIWCSPAWSGKIVLTKDGTDTQYYSGTIDTMFKQIQQSDANFKISRAGEPTSTATFICTFSYNKPFNIGIAGVGFLQASSVYNEIISNRSLGAYSYINGYKTDDDEVINTSSVISYGYRYYNEKVGVKEANNILTNFSTPKEKLTVSIPFLYDNYDILNYVTIKTDGINIPVNWKTKEFKIVGITNSYEAQTTTLELKEV